MPTSMVMDQVGVLNSAYAPSNFEFKLVTFDVTNNSAWCVTPYKISANEVGCCCVDLAPSACLVHRRFAPRFATCHESP